MLLHVRSRVRLAGLRPELSVAIIAVHAAYAKVGSDLTITAADETWIAFGLPPPGVKRETAVAAVQNGLWSVFQVIVEHDRLHVGCFGET